MRRWHACSCKCNGRLSKGTRRLCKGTRSFSKQLSSNLLRPPHRRSGTVLLWFANQPPSSNVLRPPRQRSGTVLLWFANQHPHSNSRWRCIHNRDLRFSNLCKGTRRLSNSTSCKSWAGAAGKSPRKSARIVALTWEATAEGWNRRPLRAIPRPPQGSSAGPSSRDRPIE